MQYFKNKKSTSAELSPVCQNIVAKKAHFYQSAGLLVVVVFVCLLSVGVPKTASAGFFSFLLGGTASAETSSSLHNSQTVPLPAPSVGMGTDTMMDVVSVSPKNDAFAAVIGPVGTQADIETSEYVENPETLLYVVREGETLADIAGMFDISTKTIVWANDLKVGQKLTPGQTLVILPVSGVMHTVKKGDTVAKIASKYKVDSAVIRKWNGVDEDTSLVVGDDLLIPDGAIAEQPAKTNNAKKSVAQKDFPAKKSSSNSPIVNSNLPLLARGRTRLILGYDGADLGSYFMRPVSGGKRTQGLHGQNAVDIAAPKGTPIYAAAAGVVTASKNSGFNGGLGNYVSITHANGTRTYYGHMLKTTVAEGQSVARGEQIGLIGATGLATGNHVHFAVIGAKNPLSDDPNYGL